ncbi:hypothetical protein MKW94_016809 [Papaver nudicaule]|uniref:Neprosin PEP catalytic domain-containing protein n=1 Tax=Papaver nudicaule TaxID=74823 RepID=A0AA41VT09_PAPNU|nr:hypothetical protein [Papaver nudicaule]
MASFSGLRIYSFLPFVVGLVVAYHVVMLVEGGRKLSSRLSEEEELDLERQLKILNKPPIKTMYTSRGDIYDCIEFYNQPAFDHPLLKNHSFSKRVETGTTSSHEILMSQIEGCPKGTVPIRRTTKEDLIRAKYFSSFSNAPGDEYKAGISLQTSNDSFFGASGVANVWNPNVNPDQFSGAEIAVTSGLNEIRFGWTVNPELYGDYRTYMFAYWTSDGGHTTGCYNTLCSGFVQVDQKYTPTMFFERISVIGGLQSELTSDISMERETGNLWLTLQGKIKVGYWPRELFPLLGLGAKYIYWGGRVKSGNNAITPKMASGNSPDRYTDHTGYYAELQYKNNNGDTLIPGREVLQFAVDCKGSYDALWDNKHTILHFGGPGGGTCA